VSELKTDADWLLDCYEVAAALSTDPSTQNAAVIVVAGIPACWGVNRFPHGVVDKPERWERPAKYQYVEHAERNAIYAAARHGIQTLGATMYCCWHACADCSRAIIEVGIAEIVGHRPDWRKDDRWAASVAIGHEMLREAGVKMRWVDGHLGAAPIRFDGKIVQP
jgi:dCMP deaminase